MENRLVIKKSVFGVFDQNLGPRKFHFCLGKRPKMAKRLNVTIFFFSLKIERVLITTFFCDNALYFEVVKSVPNGFMNILYYYPWILQRENRF